MGYLKTGGREFEPELKKGGVAKKGVVKIKGGSNLGGKNDICIRS